MFDRKEALLEAIRVYHIRKNVEYRTETSNQIVLNLKCKRGCSWRLRATFDSYLSSWRIITYKVSMVLVYWVVTLFRLDTFT